MFRRLVGWLGVGLRSAFMRGLICVLVGYGSMVARRFWRSLVSVVCCGSGEVADRC